MDNKSLITILTDIESAVDVNSLIYEGYSVWPFIRAQLAIRLLHGSRPQALFPPKKIENSRWGEIVWKGRRLWSFLAHNVKNSPVGERDLAFLVRTSERDKLVDGAWYNPYGDSFCDLFENKYTIQLLEFSNDGIFPQPQPRPSFYLDLRFFIFQVKGCLKRFFTAESIMGFSGLMEYLDEIGISWPDAEKSISRRLQRIFSWKQAFVGIIRKIDPKLFFITCCYCENATAAILACHDLKIPVVEFQHGAQNDNNPFLTHWTRIPDQGYEMLPDFFWNWGETSAERVQRWAGKTTKHKAFVGGNLWISKWIKNGFQTDDCERYDIEQIFPADRKHLMLSLQLWPDSLPDFLIDVITNSPPDWLWHVRQHPRHKVSEKELSALLGTGTNRNYEFRDASDMPLYLLLKNIDLHLTGYSTVAFEAAQFSISTIFYHPNARDGFKASLDDNIFCYAVDNTQLFSLIKKMLNREGRAFEKNNYININYEKQAECLEEMIDFARSKRK